MTIGVIQALFLMSLHSMSARIVSRGPARSLHVAWMCPLAASKRLGDATLWRGRSSARELAADSVAHIAALCRRRFLMSVRASTARVSLAILAAISARSEAMIVANSEASCSAAANATRWSLSVARVSSWCFVSARASSWCFVSASAARQHVSSERSSSQRCTLVRSISADAAVASRRQHSAVAQGTQKGIPDSK